MNWMNWIDEIKTMYPRAWAECLAWREKEMLLADRDLYDYFDGFGIHCSVEPMTHWGTEPLTFRARVKTYPKTSNHFLTNHKTRTEAEYAAFHRSFQLREQITTTNDNYLAGT